MTAVAAAVPCELLPWDSEFFGKRIARATVHRLEPEVVRALLDRCAEHAVDCLYFLADSDDARTVTLAEAHGFQLVDLRVTLERAPAPVPAAPSARPVLVRDATDKDIPALTRIARDGHRDSRFFFDARFPRAACEALYETWIQRSCEGWADRVVVAEAGGEAVGYVTCHLDAAPVRGRIGLVGVGEHARGGGLGRVMVEDALRWFAARGAGTVSVVTQGRNAAAQRLYQRCGFVTASVQLWYHRWFA